jgi:DNA-binding HxlR family transcriptional regulator
MKSNPSQPSKVVNLRPQADADEQASKTRRSAAAKWGTEVMRGGFVTIPSILLRAQRRLGLSGTQLTIILHLADWWLDADRAPWSSKARLSQRIGISERQLQRQIAELETRGYVKRVERVSNRGKIPNGYDLSGLVAKLNQLAPEFQRASKARQDVEKPGGLKPAKAN